MDVLTAGLETHTTDRMGSIKRNLKDVEDALVQVIWMLGL